MDKRAARLDEARRLLEVYMRTIRLVHSINCEMHETLWAFDRDDKTAR